MGLSAQLHPGFSLVSDSKARLGDVRGKVGSACEEGRL